MILTLSARNRMSFIKAVEILMGGGVLIYPTETYYAIGCLANAKNTLPTLVTLKARSLDKTLPLLAGSFVQAALVADLDGAPPCLYQTFWPGPLTLILPAKHGLSPLILNNQGKVAIRVSSGAIAARLALQCGYPLVSTSANLSGHPPASRARDIDAHFMAEVASHPVHSALLVDDSVATSSLPSTIIEPLLINGKTWKLRLLRSGVIDKNALKKENFAVME